MVKDLQLRISAFARLGKTLKNIIESENIKSLSAAARALKQEIDEGPLKNPWFIAENVKSAILGISTMLEDTMLTHWLSKYPHLQSPPEKVLTIAVVMAGNLPVVGFHDFMCVLLSGHRFLGKLSSQDQHLPVKMAELLCETEPGFSQMIQFTHNRISEFDAVIATGSNNTARYFDYYFGKYPNIIRKNRNSLAVIDGSESAIQLQNLSDDVFMYFGMGCRSVAKIFVPKGFDLSHLIRHFEKWEHLKNHHKFYNNYEYQKAIFLVNKVPHFDNGFCLFKQDDALSSPLAVVHFQEYNNPGEVADYISMQKENIQCVASDMPLDLPGVQLVPLGKTQSPGANDFADGVDTLEFLLTL